MRSGNNGESRGVGKTIDYIEGRADMVQVINNLSTITALKARPWIMAGAIMVIAGLAAISLQSVFEAVSLTLVILSLIILPAGGITTAIDLADRSIRRTWKIGAFARHRVYSIDDYETLSIQDESRRIEGYQLPFFSVYLVGARGRISIYSTDDFEEAEAIQRKIAAFLRKPD